MLLLLLLIYVWVRINAIWPCFNIPMSFIFYYPLITCINCLKYSSILYRVRNDQLVSFIVFCICIWLVVCLPRSFTSCCTYLVLFSFFIFLFFINFVVYLVLLLLCFFIFFIKNILFSHHLMVGCSNRNRNKQTSIKRNAVHFKTNFHKYVHI